MRSPAAQFPRCRWQFPDRLAILPVLAVWFALQSLAGCQSDLAAPVDDPTPSSVSFAWFPAEDEVTLFRDQELEFRVEVSGTADVSVAWTLDGQAVGTGSAYEFQAAELGERTLQARVDAGGTIRQREWRISVSAATNPAVPGIGVRHGAVPGTVEVVWQPIPPDAQLEPVTHYQAAVSYAGPIDQDNWSDAILLGSPVPAGAPFYSEQFTEAEGIVPGQQAWFMVRALDEEGGLSLVAGVFPFEISWPWYIDGYVRDESDRPLGGIIVSYQDGCPECRVNSDASGHYRIGPLFNFDTVDLATISSDAPPAGEPYTSWYDVDLPSFGYAGDQTMALDIYVVTRYGIDDGCVTVDYAGDFLAYLCYMTNNQPAMADRRLFTWNHYPVSVYVPLFMGPNGFDLGEATREMPLLWNTLLGEEFFILVDDPDLADVVFRFPYPDEPDYDLGGSRLGYTTITSPTGLVLATGIPQKMRVSIEPTLPTVQLVKEVGLHELGHVLGYANHSSCPDAPYLMDYSPAGALDNGEENAIHIDELRAVRAIRYLPQGVDLSVFEYDLP